MFDEILNKPLRAVELRNDKELITFLLEDGSTKSYGVEGDCCSSSWIEHLETPPIIEGATILSVEDGGAIPFDGHECVQYDYDKSEEENKARGYCGHDVLSVYNTRFRTSKGDIVLEYRNDSNGYYGGYLVDRSAA